MALSLPPILDGDTVRGSLIAIFGTIYLAAAVYNWRIAKRLQQNDSSGGRNGDNGVPHS
jgi:hypothetical protein